MKKKIFDILIDEDNGIDKILRRSSRAICGTFEKEIVVKNSEVSKIKNKLRNAGYIIVGTGEAGFGRKKIWFNPAGTGGI